MNERLYRKRGERLVIWSRKRVSWFRLFASIHCVILFVHASLGQSLVGSWVGVEQQLDSGFVCPLPLYLQVRSDSTYTLSLIDRAATAPRATWSVNKGRVRLDTAIFLPHQVGLTATGLQIRGSTPMLFRRVQPMTMPISETTIRSLLTNRVWQQEQVHYHFHEGGQACIEHIPSGDRAIRCWTITECEGNIFIVIKGNRVDCSRNYDTPMQLLSINSKRLVISKVSAGMSQPFSLTTGALLPAGKTCEAIGFQLCSTCFYTPYEQAMTLDKKGPPGRLYAVRQRLMADFNAGNVPEQTGLVQVRCLVNCEGQAGQFTATTYGPDYQPCQLDPRITSQLLTIFRTYFATGWRPGRVRTVSRPLDYQATINIRLVNGHITDVFP